MKKHVYGFLLASALLTGCTQENEWANITTNRDRVLTVEVENGAASRTIVDEQNRVWWSANDQIGVYGNKESQNLPFTYLEMSEEKAHFTGEMSMDEAVRFAYYPYQKDASLADHCLSFNIPAEYTYSTNTYSPLLGLVGKEGCISFTHLCGLLSVKVSEIPTDATSLVVTSEGTDAPAIAGTAVIDDVRQEDAILHLKTDGSRRITIALPTTEVSTKTFYVPLPVGTYPLLRVSLETADGTTYFERTLSNLTIQRATIARTPELSTSTESIRKTLVKLYSDTDGDNWTINTNWCSNLPLEEWYGVSFTEDGLLNLDLRKNNLNGNVDLSGCKALDFLTLPENPILSLDVSGCENLTYLAIGGDEYLSELYLSGCSNLKRTNIQYTSLTNVDVSDCVALDTLIIANSKLNTLDVSRCSKLRYLYCYNNELTSLDISSNHDLVLLSCYENMLTDLDASKHPFLRGLACYQNNLVKLNTSDNPELNTLYCQQNELVELNMANCPKLVNFNCSENPPLSSVDATNCASLEWFGWWDGKLTSLKFSGCTSLRELWCYNNQLTTLEVSGCTQLTKLGCEGNRITSEIPAWFKQLTEFYHDQRYLYHADGSYTDNGYGWWYPGEPESGKHETMENTESIYSGGNENYGTEKGQWDE